MVRAVLFDRDGVLTSFDMNGAVAFFSELMPISVLEISRRWQAFGDAAGFPHNLEEERLFFASFWQGLGNEFSLSAAQRVQLDNLDYARFVVPYPEVQSVLTQLCAQGFRLAVLSNFSLASLDHSLEVTGLAPYFVTMCAAPVIGAAKPSPRAYQIALDRLEVHPHECLFFDDEMACVEGARQLGMRAYLVDRRAAAHDFANGMVNDLLPATLLAQQR